MHNSDDSDGWEREGEDHEYFKNYSEKVAYPLAINIIFYIMTHERGTGDRGAADWAEAVFDAGRRVVLSVDSCSQIRTGELTNENENENESEERERC